MLLVKCPCAFRLRRLAQNACRRISVRHVPCKFLQEMPLVTCPCALRPRRLAQNACPGISVWHFPCKLLHKMPLVKCPCAFWVRRLAQNAEKHVWPWCRVCKSKRKPRHADFMGLGLSCARIFGSAAHAQQTPHSCSDLHPRQVRGWVGWGGMTKDFQTRTEGTSSEAAPKTSRAHEQH